MAGSKRNKRKKLSSASSPPPPAYTEKDDDLVDDLLAELDARDSNAQEGAVEVVIEAEVDSQQEDGTRKDSRSRFRAREIRKAAARAAQQTPDDVEATERIKREIQDEERTIREICDTRGLELHEINPDGHCLFAAVADQLSLLSIMPAKNANYQTIRHAAADYIASHPDDFIPFLPSAEGEDGSGATDSGLMNPQEFHKYCARIRDTGTWGGEPEILALASAFSVQIHVVQWGTPPVVVHSPQAEVGETPTDRIVQISYHRRMYGLGEASDVLLSGNHIPDLQQHYNSLRPKSRHHLPTRNIVS